MEVTPGASLALLEKGVRRLAEVIVHHRVDGFEGAGPGFVRPKRFGIGAEGLAEVSSYSYRLGPNAPQLSGAL